MSIFLTALVKSKPGKADEMKAVLQQLVIDSRKETACLQYDLHQSVSDVNLFIFHEEWASESGLQLHNTQPHISRFIQASKDIIDGGVTLHKTEKVS